MEFQQQYGRDGQSVSNALQTNGILLDKSWCELFHEYNWLIGVSLDGPEDVHDLYRFNKEGAGTWKQRDAEASRLLKKDKVEFNVLCVLSQANVDKPQRALQVLSRAGHRQHAVHSAVGVRRRTATPLPFTITPEQYGRFMCEIFDLWWPERRKVRIRYFDNIAEALAGQKPGNCTMHETCDSYVVVEYNGDVYPCDFFVEKRLEAGQHQPGFVGRNRAPHAALQLRGQEDDRASRVPGLRIPVDLPRRLPQAPARPARQLRGSGLLLRGVQDDLRQSGRSRCGRKCRN